MTIGNLTEQDIKDLIIKFNLDESINDLKRYYSTPTTWETINQSRKETTHSQFLATIGLVRSTRTISTQLAASPSDGH